MAAKSPAIKSNASEARFWPWPMAWPGSSGLRCSRMDMPEHSEVRVASGLAGTAGGRAAERGGGHDTVVRSRSLMYRSGFEGRPRERR